MWCIYLEVEKLDLLKDEDLKRVLAEINKHSGGWYLIEDIQDSWWGSSRNYQLIKYRGIWGEVSRTEYGTKEFMCVTESMSKKDMMLFLRGLMEGLYAR